MSRADRKAKVLPCVLCSELFSQVDVKHMRYFPSTMICLGCYKSAARTPHSTWCFGKLTVKQNLGYDEKAKACSVLCPDRSICRLFALRELGNGQSSQHT